MSEIRQNKVTGKWVIYAPARGERPRDYQRSEKERILPQHDPDCPFCPGNEHMLPGIIVEQPGPEQDHWQTRIVPNKFPALTQEGGTKRKTEGLYLVMQGYGRHEVIIENPLHNRGPACMSKEEMQVLIETYHQRYVEVMQAPDNLIAVLFRNHGERAGTSLMHPHSQLVVTGIVPRHIRWQEAEAQRYFDEWGRCVLCDVAEYEMQEGRRIILENDSVLAFVPFAARVPFEVWVVPRKHQAGFGAITNAEKSDLAAALRDVLGRLYNKLNDPDYNYVIHSATRHNADESHLHWYLRIQPRLTRQAGFEIGTGMRINPSLPEEDANFLNGKSPNSG